MTARLMRTLTLGLALALAGGGWSVPAATNGLHRLDPGTPAGLQALLRFTGEPLPCVSAHRGGPRPGLPENCLATFAHTLRHTWALLEVDPRRTKDGGIVLHHDATLERTTTGTGKVADFTVKELQALRLKDPTGRVTEFRMPTLDEALDWARGNTVLVLDQKDVSVADRVARVTARRAEAHALLIVNTFPDAQVCHALNPDIMMEVMIPTRAKAEEFARLGIPWRNVVAFVGHTPPTDPALYAYLHQQGVLCLIGTSRNLDRQILSGAVPEIKSLEPAYRAFLERGADLIETDLPALLGPLLYGGLRPPAAKAKYFHAP